LLRHKPHSRLRLHVGIQLAEVEQDLAVTQKAAVEAERQLELVKAAERRVKDASATLKRVASEQVDERLT
jgi:hypothetical protein